jgi:hypothetical protein
MSIIEAKQIADVDDINKDDVPEIADIEMLREMVYAAQAHEREGTFVAITVDALRDLLSRQLSSPTAAKNFVRVQRSQ